MKTGRINQRTLIKDIIIGMSDGLTVPFALTASLSGVLNTNHLIIVSGLAEIAAGSISMGLGGFLAGESEVDHYNAALLNEYKEIETVPHLELKEVEDALTGMGVDEALSRQVALQITRDKDKWASFIMQTELRIEKPDAGRAGLSGITIALSYLGAGLIPLLPYVILPDNKAGFNVSCIVTISCLITLGYFKSKVNRPTSSVGNNKGDAYWHYSGGSSIYAGQGGKLKTVCNNNIWLVEKAAILP